MTPLLLLAALAADPAAGDWPTHRGNPARTGWVDGKPGPAAPKLEWVLKSKDHYVAAPVVAGPNIIVSGLGAFNRPTLTAFPLTGTGPPKAVWERSAPYLRQASMSSPAVADGLVVFGDGVHTDAGGVLHCLTADAGRPVWQRPTPGELVHLEGAPTVHAGRVYMGGGAAGVVCVELGRATLDGEAVPLAAIRDRQDARWKELQATYEAAKKRDPDLAVPPTEDQLLKFAPKPVWAVGAGAWHVDAPVNVVGDKVLVCTCYLDKEKAGERALYCLAADTGKTLWKQPLPLNPWGGAAVLGDTVVVAGSSVAFYYNQIAGAKGDLAAFDLNTGMPKWHKPLPGGVVGGVALADGLAVAAATDGKVRAFDLTTGDRRWVYDCRAPLFAPPAVAAGTVYVGDLRGTVHALTLGQGTPVWKLDLGTDPAVKSPGMIYGGPVVHGGKLYVGTANIDGPLAQKPTCVVCIGGK